MTGVPVSDNFDPICFEALVGMLKAGKQPLARIGANINWLYAKHAPSPLNMAPLCKEFRRTHEFVAPIVPSADSLVYEFHIATYAEAGTQINYWIDYRVDDSDTSATWTIIGTGNYTHSATAGEWWGPRIPAHVIPAEARYLKFKFESQTGLDFIQPHAVCIVPQRMTGVLKGRRPSGFVCFNPAIVETPGAPIHTEYFNRLHRNVICTMRDRRQSVLTMVAPTNYQTYLLGRSGNAKSVQAFYGQAVLLGQAGATLTIRARVAGPSNSVLLVSEVNGDTADPIPCDDTDRTATIRIKSERPIFRGSVQWGATDGTAEVRYITIDWRPGD